MEIKILGGGCPKCKALEKATINALVELNIAANVSKVEDIMEIMKYGIISTPALIIDEKVVIKGRVPSKEEIIKMLFK